MDLIETIIKKGIKDSNVINVMRKTPRNIFIPKHLKYLSNIDTPLPIGQQQTISQPSLVALMTELLRLTGTEKVLEIGTGSGYQTAILSLLCNKVYSIEINKLLAKAVKERLKKNEYYNVSIKNSDGYLGWVKYAPYDRIIVTAAPDHVPEILINQLKIGGRLVLPVGTYNQQLKVITKLINGKLREKIIIPVRFVQMIHSK